MQTAPGTRRGARITVLILPAMPDDADESFSTAEEDEELSEFCGVCTEEEDSDEEKVVLSGTTRACHCDNRAGKLC